MSGNPAALVAIPFLFLLLLIYGCLIINIPIGIFWGLFCLFRHPCIEEDLKQRNLQVCGNAFISALPFCGPMVAFNRLMLP